MLLELLRLSKTMNRKSIFPSDNTIQLIMGVSVLLLFVVVTNFGTKQEEVQEERETEDDDVDVETSDSDEA